jgi:hypothetical protein
MKFKNFFLNFFLILFSTFIILIILEIFCRFYVDFNSGYYSSSKKNLNNALITHPYGKIPVNKYGFFDEEFRLKEDKQVIAYFGDSVTYGVGAGYPYRFTEYLDEINSKFEHINLSGGLGVSLSNWSLEFEKFLLENNINRVVYVMNLNDIAPLSNPLLKNSDDKQNIKNLNFIKKIIKPLDSILRGNSELYTYLRFLLKKQFVKAGYEASGYESIELFSENNQKNIITVSNKIDKWLDNTQKKGFKSCVVVLPYEMQISKDAERFYRSINIKFEKNFVNFSTQKLIKKNLKNKERFFIINKDGFREKKVGHYFVFNKGDKIDFNHPNREGHFIIAKEINKKNICQN